MQGCLAGVEHMGNHAERAPGPAALPTLVPCNCRYLGTAAPTLSNPLGLQVKQKEYEVLCVSQFTLYGRLSKPRPDFSKAMPPQQVCVASPGVHPCGRPGVGRGRAGQDRVG